MSWEDREDTGVGPTPHIVFSRFQSAERFSWASAARSISPICSVSVMITA
jgi:hypothetical protein